MILKSAVAWMLYLREVKNYRKLSVSSINASQIILRITFHFHSFAFIRYFFLVLIKSKAIILHNN